MTDHSPNAGAPSDRFPNAIRWPDPIGGVNEPIELYHGLADFSQKDKATATVELRVWLDWLPRPTIRFETLDSPQRFMHRHHRPRNLHDAGCRA